MLGKSATSFLLIALSVATALCASHAAAESYHSSEFGYDLELPQGWIQIPPDVMQEFMALQFQENSDIQINYEAGFQLDSAAEWFEYPYVLLQPIPNSQFGLHRQITNEELPEILEAFTGVEFDTVRDKLLTAEANEALGPMEIGRPLLNVDRRRYLLAMDMNVEGIGPVRAQVAGYFGRESLVQVNFYGTRDSWDQYADQRHAILDSFRFEPAQAYSEELAASQSNNEKLGQDIARWVALGVPIVISLVLLVFAIILAVVIIAVQRKGRAQP